MLRNREDSEDVLQDALSAAYKNIHHLQFRARFATWMHAILCNSARTMWRKRRSRPVTSSFALDREDEHLLLIDDIPSQGLSPEEEYCRTEAAGTVAAHRFAGGTRTKTREVERHETGSGGPASRSVHDSSRTAKRSDRDYFALPARFNSIPEEFSGTVHQRHRHVGSRLTEWRQDSGKGPSIGRCVGH